MRKYLLFLIAFLVTSKVFAQPTISSFVPMMGPIGTIVTISGTNFSTNITDNVVFFGAVQAIVSNASANSLTVSVPFGTTYEPITVTNINTNLTAYSTRPFHVIFPGAGPAFTSTSFIGPINFLAGSFPEGLCHVDLDKDGKPDIATANAGLTGNSFSALLNNSTAGTLSFEPQIETLADSGADRVVKGDFDGDGLPDLAVSNINGFGSVNVYRNTSSLGNISFAPKIQLIHRPFIIGIAIVDIDRDGKPDLIATEGSAFSFSVYRNTSTVGLISFASPVTTFFTANPSDVICRDLDGDEKPDLAFTIWSNNTMIVLRNISNPGSISFGPQLILPTGDFPQGIAVGDLDGDGHLDMAVTNFIDYTRSYVSVFKNSGVPGTISFLPKVVYSIGAIPNGITIGDLDGDGLPEISVACRSSWNVVSILKNKVVCIAATINTQPADSTICSGANAAFSITATNSLSYQWQVNDGTGWVDISNNVIYSGATGNTLQINGATAMMNNYTYRCNAFNSCGIVNSESALLSVNETKPDVSITATAVVICPGSSVTFTALPVNGGAAPVFQWKKNNLNVGSNATTYTDISLNIGDIISCVMTSYATAACLTTNTANSNAITMAAPNLPGNVDLGPDKNSCIGSTVLINPQPGFTSYLWQDNSTNPVFNATVSGQYYLQAADACGNVSSDSIYVDFKPTPANFLPPDTSVCSYEPVIINPMAGFSQYLWSTNAGSPSITVSTPGMYWLQVTDNNNCVGRDSINITAKNCLKGLYIPTAFTPNGDSKNDDFKPLIFGTVKQYEFRILNRYGEQIFYSKELGKGWNGKLKVKDQHLNVFVWTCTYQLEGQMVNIEKGSVVLIR